MQISSRYIIANQNANCNGLSELIRNKIKKICGNKAVPDAIALADERAAAAVAVDMAVTALMHAVFGEHMQYLRTGIMKIQRRIMEKDELFPLAGAFERRFQPPDLAPEDFGVMLRAGLFVFKPAARAAQRQIFSFRRVIMQQIDGF